MIFIKKDEDKTMGLFSGQLLNVIEWKEAEAKEKTYG